MTEVRLFGAASIQVPRRLRAMLGHLSRFYLKRAPALRRERVVKAPLNAIIGMPKTAGARAADRQGIGSSSSRTAGCSRLQYIRALHQRLIDDRMLHVVLVLMLTATLGLVLTVHGPIYARRLF